MCIYMTWWHIHGIMTLSRSVCVCCVKLSLCMQPKSFTYICMYVYLHDTLTLPLCMLPKALPGSYIGQWSGETRQLADSAFQTHTRNAYCVESITISPYHGSLDNGVTGSSVSIHPHTYAHTSIPLCYANNHTVYIHNSAYNHTRVCRCERCHYTHTRNDTTRPVVVRGIYVMCSCMVTRGRGTYHLSFYLRIHMHSGTWCCSV